MSEAARNIPWEPPKTFDSFVVEGPLGVGGMGHVYLGRDVMLDRRVALKFIAGGSPSPEARRRFMIEARAIAKLAHPNVVGVFRIGEVEDRPYIAYELVDGKSLDALARPIPWSAVLRIATLLARGLEAAHRSGIVHRDIKPSNVMVASTGEVKLLDFGIAKLDANTAVRDEFSTPPTNVEAVLAAMASGDTVARTRRGKLTRPGVLIGTPAYFAPELWTGEDATRRSDVYAVGLVMFELCTGALPFAPLVGQQLAEAVIERDPPPIRSLRPDIPPAFATIIDTCLRRDARARYESAVELRAALEQLKAVYLASDEGDEVRFTGEARIVADSFARLLPRIEHLVSGVYTRLFATDPSTRTLFPEDMTGQRRKLAHALKLAIDGLQEPERSVDLLRELGRRHAGYGVTPSHFETLGNALHATVRELEAEVWSDELSGAWRQAYDFIATAMRQGLFGVGETEVSALGGPSPYTPPGSSPPKAEPVPTSPPRTLYARNGDVSLAYHVMGEGPDLVVVLGWVTHVELAHTHPSLVRFLRTLAQAHRVIVFDKRGTGLSDRVIQGSTLEERADDIAAVMDAASSSRAAIFGAFDGATLAASFAARSPERVRALALWGARAHGGESLDATFERIHAHWGDTSFAELVAPSMTSDRSFIDWLATTMRTAASPGNAIALLKAQADVDLRPVLPTVAVPTLVMHRRGDRFAPARDGEALAALVPNARWSPFDGDDHLPFAGDAGAVLAALAAFLETLPR